MVRTLRITNAIGLVLLLASTVRADPPPDFQKQIAPIFEKHCLSCHSPNIQKGDLSMSSIADLMQQQHIVPGNPDESHLVELISGPNPEMPKDGPPVPKRDVDLIRQWIKSGADWPAKIVLREQAEVDRSWWSLQPLSKASPPAGDRYKNPIDAFIAAKHDEHDLKFNPAATARELIRRATYDLTGLPPTPEEVQQFVSDSSDNAYERLIDRLLASPHYGERWGRHWLDVVRFGESNGFERNILINNLWPFRDYVIKSLNADKPMDQFIREHLAGDVIDPGNPRVETATAFLVCGPYDNVGNSDAVAAKQIRANTIDEMIRATSEAFLGMTVGCARCHDHKFDPIRQSDYYRLYATLSGVRHGSKTLINAEQQAKRQVRIHALRKQQSSLKELRSKLDAAINARADAYLEQASRLWTRGPVDRRGTTETFVPTKAKFVRLTCEGRDDAPQAKQGFGIDEFEVWSAGENSRNVALAANGGKATGPSRNIEDFPGAYGPQLAIDGKTGARFLATSPQLVIELAEAVSIERVVFSSAKGEVKPDQAKFKFVGEYKIEISIDGTTWSEVANGRDRKPASEAHRKHRLRTLVMTANDRKTVAGFDKEGRLLQKKIDDNSGLQSVWVGTRTNNRGSFHVFVGGDPQRKGEPVVPASLSILQDATKPYKLDSKQPEAVTRRTFANWVTQADNPLTPRVLANRIWHYHFGTGIVNTPSDFGFMGGRPSHPELLDWLARRLIDGGWQMKPLHKLIMMSRTYRQSSTTRPDAAKIDGDSRLLWRFPAGRLSAEEIRDTMLSVAGKLDLRAGGPGFRLYKYLQDNVATYVPLDKHGPETYRRAIYHQNARASVTDLMTDFDQPDCAFSTPRRARTTTPLQALTALNHSFTLDMAAALADRTVKDVGEDPVNQVHRVWQLCFSRTPDEIETDDCVRLIRQHSLKALCRVILNTSELIYVR